MPMLHFSIKMQLRSGTRIIAKCRFLQKNIPSECKKKAVESCFSGFAFGARVSINSLSTSGESLDPLPYSLTILLTPIARESFGRGFQIN